ncbi:MAG: pilin [Halioglobus sp.]
MNIQKSTQQGFTLIELMIVIAIIGILAAIALPAYQDYTVRAKMSEPMAALSEAKTSVTEYYSTRAALPQNNTDAGVARTRTSEYIDEILVATATGGPLISAAINGGVVPGVASPSFVLSGTTQNDGTINWTCKSQAVTGSTAILAKYLPATCR